MKRVVCKRCDGSGNEPSNPLVAVATFGLSPFVDHLENEDGERPCNLCRGRGYWVDSDE